MSVQNTKRSFAAGETIIRQGDKGDCAYIIEDGQVEILIERDGVREQHVGTRGPGAIVGEMAIVDDGRRVATVRALKDTKVLEITREDYVSRLTTSDPVIQMITQVILTRYRDTLTRVEILGASPTFPPAEVLERDFAAQTNVVESVKIANEFKTALEKGELFLNYQPIIDLAKGEIAGFEALMRWMHPEKGFISPGVFIPVAERSGLIADASRWAIKEACAALRRIEDKARPKKPLYMSVNFSSHDFSDPDFVGNVVSAARGAGIRPEQVVLEITEGLLITQPDIAKAALEECSKEGVGIAIDDFGTGYSSLSYLYYFPISMLKIDQSFIRSMYREDRNLELVKSIAGLAMNLNLTCVAEGVEHPDEARLLRDIGCDKAQGYYFARPMPEDDVIGLLSGWSPKRVVGA